MGKVNMSDRYIRVIVAGGRDFLAYNAMCKYLDKLTADIDYVTVVSGGAKGADMLGERWAVDRGWVIERHVADWDRYGKSAGYRRNEDMAKVATHLVAFWDGKSKGTKHMIDLAEQHGLVTRVGKY